MTLESVSNMMKEMPYNQDDGVKYGKGRERVIQGREKEFGIEGRYVGTGLQNRKLFEALNKYPELLERFRGERIQITLETEKPLRSLKKLLVGLKREKEHIPSKSTDIQVSDASVYHEGEDKWGGKTALGNSLHYSDNSEIPTSCAANWGKFPPGTILRVNGKKYVVEDYGSFVNSHPNRIDRYMPKRMYKSQLAMNPRVEILQWGDFAKAERILKTRKPQKHSHIAMMLQQVREKLV